MATTTTTTTEYSLSEPDEDGESTILGETTTESVDDAAANDLKAAQAEAARAEAAAHLAEQRKTVAEAQKAEIELRKALRAEAEELSADKHHRTYYFRGAVDDASVQKCIDQLNIWRRNSDPAEIELVFFSPGGSVMAGMALYDFIIAMRNDGWKFTTVARGYAASMGSILLQAGDVRVCGPESYILIHEISSGSIGKIGELEDEVEFLKLVQDRVYDIFVKRSGGKLTKSRLKGMVRRKDFWIDSKRALELGVVDAVR